MKKKIIAIYQKWINLKPLYFILTTTLLMFLMKIPIAVVFEFLNLTDNEFGGVDFDKYRFLGIIFAGLISAPIIETLISQQIPILLTQKYIKHHPNLIGLILSTIIFSSIHLTHSIWYAISVIPSGLLLAHTFLIFQKRKESSFWMTSFVHSFKNLLPIIIVLIEKFIK